MALIQNLDIVRKLKLLSFLNSGVFPIFLFCSFFLNGCYQSNLKPLHGLNSILLELAKSNEEPSLGREWLVSLAVEKGKRKIQMIDIRSRRKIPLPGINRADAQPISVSVSADGKSIAFVRQIDGRTELMVYKRQSQILRRIEINPKGVPYRVSFDGAGKLLAVQISRQGRWDIDVIRLSTN